MTAANTTLPALPSALASLHPIAAQVGAELTSARDADLDFDKLVELVAPTGGPIPREQVAAARFAGRWQLLIATEPLGGSDPMASRIITLDEAGALEQLSFSAFRARETSRVKRGTCLKGAPWAAWWDKTTFLPLLDFDGPAWAGTHSDFVFDDHDWTFELDGETYEFNLNAATIVPAGPGGVAPGTWMDFCSDGASMTTGDIGYTLAADADGGVWVDLWGYQIWYLGQPDPESFDPCQALLDCLDGAELSGITYFTSDTLDRAGLVRAIKWIRHWDPNFYDGMSIEAPDFTGTAAELLEADARAQ